MGISLANQAVIVVGASSGMGRATALALAREGARVMAAARRREKLVELPAHGIEICTADATRREDMERLAAAALEKFGRIDVMVYSAGDNIPRRAMNVLTPETWEMMIGVNLTGAFHATQAVLPAMRAQDAGLIIYVSSIAAKVPDTVSGPSYQAAKRGLSGLAHAVRLEEKPNGVRVSVILPGLCRTDLVYKRPAPTPPEVLEKALEAEDVAEAVVAVAKLHPRTVVPEMELLPSRL
jgi:NADP-dependent 3-hydroxy acid dehydrogenase YdfG